MSPFSSTEPGNSVGRPVGDVLAGLASTPYLILPCGQQGSLQSTDDCKGRLNQQFLSSYPVQEKGVCT